MTGGAPSSSEGRSSGERGRDGGGSNEVSIADAVRDLSSFVCEYGSALLTGRLGLDGDRVQVLDCERLLVTGGEEIFGCRSRPTGQVSVVVRAFV